MPEALKLPHLVLAATDYTLLFERQGGAAETMVLPDGPRSLIDPMRRMNEAVLEMAIEKAENWLMPFVPALRDKTLDISDPTGRFRAGLQAVLSVTAGEWGVPEVESLFLRVVDQATGRNATSLDGQQGFVADLLLLRELAHHGRLQALRLFS